MGQGWGSVLRSRPKPRQPPRFDLIPAPLKVDPAKYKGLGQSISLIMKEEGALGIWKGWLPTAIGYSFQGCFKFGLYEVRSQHGRLASTPLLSSASRARSWAQNLGPSLGFAAEGWLALSHSYVPLLGGMALSPSATSSLSSTSLYPTASA